jgi:hypothetical protein
MKREASPKSHLQRQESLCAAEASCKAACVADHATRRCCAPHKCVVLQAWRMKINLLRPRTIPPPTLFLLTLASVSVASCSTSWPQTSQGAGRSTLSSRQRSIAVVRALALAAGSKGSVMTRMCAGGARFCWNSVSVSGSRMWMVSDSILQGPTFSI